MSTKLTLEQKEFNKQARAEKKKVYQIRKIVKL
jgi:hypothetical protein